jgi:hypothetical protein
LFQALGKWYMEWQQGEYTVTDERSRADVNVVTRCFATLTGHGGGRKS